MGFTIGSSRGIREIRPGARRRGRSSECTAVAEYTGLWGWDVVAGARAAGGACSCGLTACPTPGAHPLGFAPGSRPAPLSTKSPTSGASSPAPPSCSPWAAPST